jgi:simple sugar transport system ATP-binding protein/D-xylose transport system ATP-binding protein
MYYVNNSRNLEIAVADKSVLSLKGISKHFGAVAALTEVDLEVFPGEVVALVGDNGAGKSTLVKILSGVHEADAGEIVFNGQTVQIPNPMAAHQMGIATVYQDLALCDNLTVVENLFLGQEINKKNLDKVSMEVKSWGFLKRLSAKIPSINLPIASLSGGQRQTVAIARSLIGEPKLIILDEPTAALGVAQTAEVLNLVDSLRSSGMAVIIVSHNMADVRAVSDRIAVFRLGRNNGIFDAKKVSNEELVAAITGATDNAVTRRATKSSS